MDNKIIVISGGSRGLGTSYAKTLCKDNTVIMLSRTKETLEQVANELGCQYKVCDITLEEDVSRVIKEIEQEHGHVDVLINNAGIWLDGNLEDHTFDQIQRVINTNLVGQIFLTKATLPLLKKSPKSLIVNTNSTAGVTVRGDISVYNASKWGLKAFSMALNDNLKQHNVVSIDVFPGGIDTTLFDMANSPRDQSKYLNPDVIAELVEKNIRLYFDEDTVIDQIRLRHLK